MREEVGIYRAKELHTGKWVEGFLVGDDDEDYFILRLKEDEDDFPIDIMDMKYSVSYVDEETISEDTGAYDSYNGIELFENYIVGFLTHSNVAHTGVINKCEGQYWIFANDGEVFPLYAYKNHVRVLGNAFDNHELLEEEKG